MLRRPNWPISKIPTFSIPSLYSFTTSTKHQPRFGAYTGQDCFVTEVCTDGTDGQQGPDQVCGAGFTSVSTAHSPIQQPGRDIKGACSKGWYRRICCPTTAMPSNCQWNGAPVRSEIGCSGFCGTDQFQLNTDTYIDADGTGPCYQGQRTLCCDSTEILTQCSWTGCQGPSTDSPSCPDGTTLMTTRYDDGKGGEYKIIHIPEKIESQLTACFRLLFSLTGRFSRGVPLIWAGVLLSK